MTDHRRTLDLAAGALDWDLSAEESHEMTAHLATCASCRHTSAIQQGQAITLRSLTFAETPATVRAVVLAAASSDARRRWPSWTLLAAAALIALVAIGAAVGAYLQERDQQPSSLEVAPGPLPQPTTAFSEPSPEPGPSVLGGGLILIRDAASGAVSTVDAGTASKRAWEMSPGWGGCRDSTSNGPPIAGASCSRSGTAAATSCQWTTRPMRVAI